MKICPTCNAQLPDDATFCSACGTAIAAAAPAPEQAAAPEQTAAPEQAAPVYTQPAPQYAPAPVVNPYDHTAEFDADDISENKCYAMLIYLMSLQNY